MKTHHQGRVFILWGMLPAIATALLVFILQQQKQHPRFVATVTYIINWDRMPTVEDTKQGHQFRADVRKEMLDELSKPKPLVLSEAVLAKWNSQPANPPRTLGSILDAVDNRLHMMTHRRDATVDEFRVEFSDNDTNFARLVVDGVIAEAREKVKAMAGANYVGANVQSFVSLGKAMEREDQLRQQPDEWSQIAVTDLTSLGEATARRRASQDELAAAEIDHAIAGFTTLTTLFGPTGSDAFKITQPVTITVRTKPGAAVIAFPALISGALIGTAGFGIALRHRRAAPRTHSRPPIIPSPLPPAHYEGSAAHR